MKKPRASRSSLFLFVSSLFISLLFVPPRAFPSSKCRDLFPLSPEQEIFSKMEAAGHHYVRFSLRKKQGSRERELDAQALLPLPAESSIYVEKTSEMEYADGFIIEEIDRTVQEDRRSWRLEPVQDYDESYIFDVLAGYGHESLHFINRKSLGLRFIAAIHNSALGHGASIGGSRIWGYRSEAEGLIDALRLSEGMSYKAAVADLPAGGGKAVIFADPKMDKSFQMLRGYGQYLMVLNELNKNKVSGDQPFFSTGEDMGLEPADLNIIQQTGKEYLLGLPEESGDPAILTAEGVFAGIQASAQRAMGKSDVSGLEVFVQGAGNVGSRVVELLSRAGAKVSVHDVDAKKARCLSQRFGAQLIDGHQALHGVCDVFVPCAMGSVVNAETVRNFHCKIIAGSANNQLEELKYGDILKEMGILYAPDYVINAGGLISVSRNIVPLDEGQDPAKWAEEKTKDIYNTLMHIFQISERQNISTAEAAEQLAKQRIMESQKVIQLWPKKDWRNRRR